MLLYLKIKYNLKEDRFETETNIAPDKLGEVVSDYLRSQMGLGSDPRNAAVRDIYEIEIKLDLSEDSYHVTSNTDNDSLTVGIVAHYMRTLTGE